MPPHDPGHIERLVSSVRKHRWILLLAMGIGGALLSLALMRQAQQSEERLVALAAAREADDYAAGIGHELDRGLERIGVLADAVAASANLDQRQFAQTVRPTLLRQKIVEAVSWIPRVSDAERQTFETQARDNGVLDFVIRQKTPEGFIPAGQRDFYLPVLHLEPSEIYSSALGFDMLADPTRKSALEAARDSGKPAASAPTLQLVNDQNSAAVLLFFPVYNTSSVPPTVEQRRAEFRGAVGGSILIPNVVIRALGILKHETFDFGLYDVTDAAQPLALTLHSAESLEPLPPGSPPPTDTSLTQRRTLPDRKSVV